MNELYVKSLLTTKIFIKINLVGKNLQDTLKELLYAKVSNKCIAEGYVSPNNIKIITTSAGIISSDYIVYEVLYECMICHPVEGMQFIANVKSVTKAGIHARIHDNDDNIPIMAFVSRDHNNMDENFYEVKDQDVIVIKIIGIRYEVNDEKICAISLFISQYQNQNINLANETICDKEKEKVTKKTERADTIDKKKDAKKEKFNDKVDKEEDKVEDKKEGKVEDKKEGKVEDKKEGKEEEEEEAEVEAEEDDVMNISL